MPSTLPMDSLVTCTPAVVSARMWCVALAGEAAPTTPNEPVIWATWPLRQRIAVPLRVTEFCCCSSEGA